MIKLLHISFQTIYASLLIPGFEFASKTDNPDPRLSEHLNLSEFITAFGKYKRIMAEAFPQRRSELDCYEGILVDLHNTHGKVFYDYHRLFSAKCAGTLRLTGVKIDWSLLDVKVYNRHWNEILRM